MKPNIGITEKHLVEISKELTALLADEMVLYVKTRKFHWNVSGESFMELHKLFEAQYKQLEEYIDAIAERIGKLGEKTVGTMTEFSKMAKLKENPGAFPYQKNMLIELNDDHETIIKQVRKQVELCANKYNDAGTADFLTGIMEEHETMAWILRRYM